MLLWRVEEERREEEEVGGREERRKKRRRRGQGRREGVKERGRKKGVRKREKESRKRKRGGKVEVRSYSGVNTSMFSVKHSRTLTSARSRMIASLTLAPGPMVTPAPT